MMMVMMMMMTKTMTTPMMMMMMMKMMTTTAKMMVMIIKIICRLNSLRLDEKQIFCLVTHSKMQFKVYPPQHIVTCMSDYRRGLDW
jgi:hypothetical protein